MHGGVLQILDNLGNLAENQLERTGGRGGGS